MLLRVDLWCLFVLWLWRENCRKTHLCAVLQKANHVELEVDAVWKAGFDDLSEGSKLKPVGQSNKVVLYTASVAGALTFSKVGLNGEGRGWTAEISKKGKNHKKQIRKQSFCFVWLLSCWWLGQSKRTCNNTNSCQPFHTDDAYLCRSAKSCVQSTELYVNILKSNNYDVKMKN